jgi:hypothetical protein
LEARARKAHCAALASYLTYLSLGLEVKCLLPRKANGRSLLRWLLSLGFLVTGLILVIRAPHVVFQGIGIPWGYFAVILGVTGIIGCLFRLNVFAGGPLDMRNE